MHSSNPAFTSPSAQKSDSAFDDLTATLGDMRPHPTEEALVQLGRALMTELLDLISDTALEDFQTLLGEAPDRRLPFGGRTDRARCGPGARCDAPAGSRLRRIGGGRRRTSGSDGQGPGRRRGDQGGRNDPGRRGRDLDGRHRPRSGPPGAEAGAARI